MLYNLLKITAPVLNFFTIIKTIYHEQRFDFKKRFAGHFVPEQK